MALQDWKTEAEQEAKRYSDALKQNNQYLIDQLNQSKQNTLNQLQEQQNNSIYNLNTNKAEINQTAVDNAKQLNVARLLALKNNQSAMNRAGLGTQGVVGSQVNSINNDYGTNLTNILNQKTTNLRNLEKEKNDTLLTYNTNRLNLENEYGNNLANLQAQINEKALNQYNTVYNNYLAYKQQEYENQQAELQRQEAIRQYNESLALQKAQLELQKQQANRSSSSTYNYNSTSNSSNDFSDGSSSTIKTKYYSGSINPDTQYGTFGTKDLNGINYQPDNIGGQKLKSSGKKVSQMTGTTGNNNSSGVNIDGQTVWTVNGKYYIWNGSKNKYEEVRFS